MKSETAGDLFAFQKWLHESIRRTWILAIAVAIPGALLVTLWFPHSGLALVAVVLVGIGIGAVSDLVEQARKRKREELAELTAGIYLSIRRAVSRFQPSMKVPESSPVEAIASELAALKSEIELFRGSNLRVFDEIQNFRDQLVELTKLQATHLWKIDPASHLESYSPKSGELGYVPVVISDPLRRHSEYQIMWGAESILWSDSQYRELATSLGNVARQKDIPVGALLVILQQMISSAGAPQPLQKSSEESPR